MSRRRSGLNNVIFRGVTHDWDLFSTTGKDIGRLYKNDQSELSTLALKKTVL